MCRMNCFIVSITRKCVRLFILEKRFPFLLSRQTRFYSFSSNNANSNCINNKINIDNNKQDIQKRFAAAVKEGKIEEMKKTIELGANVDSSEEDHTALCEAVINNNKEMMEHLIKMGANINLKSSTGNTPIMMAVQYNNKEMVEKFIQLGTSLDTFLSVGRMEEEVSDMEGLRFDHAYIRQYSLLHIAVSNGNLEMINLLLENGCHLETVDWNWETPLFTAISKYNTYPECTKILLDKGANVNVKDKEEQKTPLHLAASLGFTKACGELIIKGAIINARKSNNQTPYDVAEKSGHLHTAQFLKTVESRLNPDAKNESSIHLTRIE